MSAPISEQISSHTFDSKSEHSIQRCTKEHKTIFSEFELSNINIAQKQRILMIAWDSGLFSDFNQVFGFRVN